jgi:cyanophycinase-like exopeptidase
MGFVRQLVTIPLFANVIMDSHFGDESAPPLNHDRMGRLVAFLARMMARGKKGPEVLGGKAVARGLGVNAQTAVLVEKNGTAQVVGNSYAYFLTAPGLWAGGKPLQYAKIKVSRLKAGGTFTFQVAAWANFNGDTTYTVSAVKMGQKSTLTSSRKSVY